MLAEKSYEIGRSQSHLLLSLDLLQLLITCVVPHTPLHINGFQSSVYAEDACSSIGKETLQNALRTENAQCQTARVKFIIVSAMLCKRLLLLVLIRIA